MIGSCNFLITGVRLQPSLRLQCPITFSLINCHKKEQFTNQSDLRNCKCYDYLRYFDPCINMIEEKTGAIKGV